MHSTIISGNNLKRIRDHAEKAWINGHSHIRTSDRSQKGLEDQLVGQLGEFALARFLGDEEQYFIRRERIDKTPWMGDDGSDFLSVGIDIKTSLMRASKNPMRYNLLVRPAERHEGNVYILGLVESLEDPIKVLLVGSCIDEDLPETPEDDGPFRGAYKVPATQLDLIRRSDLIAYVHEQLQRA